MKILAIAAHPDDLDFGCAGSTATWTNEGHEVVYGLATSGEAGGSDNTITREAMAEIRRAEQTAAAKVVGVSELHFLGFPDGAVLPDLDLRCAIARLIRIVRPDRVVGQSPERNFNRIYGSHPDHLATGEATFNAVYPDARNQFAFPHLLADEGLEPHAVPELWLMGGPDANHHIDITKTIDAKIEALMCHVSQMAEPERMAEQVRKRSLSSGKRVGLPEGSSAEVFRVVQTM